MEHKRIAVSGSLYFFKVTLENHCAFERFLGMLYKMHLFRFYFTLKTYYALQFLCKIHP